MPTRQRYQHNSPSSMSSLNDIESSSSLRGQPSLARRYLLQRRLKSIAVVTSFGMVIFLVLSYRTMREDFGGALVGGPVDWKNSAELEAATIRQSVIDSALRPYNLPPDDPDPKTLELPERYFPDIDVDDLPAPNHRQFPMDQYTYIYPIPSAKPRRPEKPAHQPLPAGSFIKSWESPEWFHTDGRGMKEMPKVQFDFGKDHETAEEKDLRIRRRNAIRRAFGYAWQQYKEKAWGHDEVKPVSGVISNPFQNWGASIIDSLETLLIMGMSKEYNLCRKHVNMVDFRLVNGRDWAYGYRPSPETIQNSEQPEWMKHKHEEGRDVAARIASFEMGIRYLGGLVGAYDLSGDVLMLERAKELGKILGRGFESPSGLVLGRFDAGSEQDWYQSGRVSLAEVGSMTLELTRLSQVSGDRWYFDRAQRAIDYLDQVVIPRSELSPLLPSMFDSQVERTNLSVQGEYTFGGMADSYYEYLIKQHQLVGGATEQYSEMYEEAIDMAEEYLFMDLDIYAGRDLMTIGSINHNIRYLTLEHLTCFAGGMLGLGARLLNRAKDLVYGQRLTQTCYWMGSITTTGLQAEKTDFHTADEPWAYSNLTISLGLFDKEGEEEVVTKEILMGTPPGAKAGNKVYIGRPETAESVFYMYRLTGDKKWQEKGWRMFTSWIDSCTAGSGLSSVSDVNASPARLADNMESFVFAETFKYYYLLQSEPDLISLDDYVFTTEAHPLLLRNRAPGSDGFWSGPGPEQDDLGERAFGTDAQLWERHGAKRTEEERQARLAQRPRPGPGHGSGSDGHHGGGKGMGGGGVPPAPPRRPNHPGAFIEVS